MWNCTALVAALIALLLVAGCHSSTSRWVPETTVETTELGPMKCEAVEVAGRLELRLSTPVSETTALVEREVVEHTVLRSTINWSDVGSTLAYSGVVVVLCVLYVVIYVLAIAVGSEGT